MALLLARNHDSAEDSRAGSVLARLARYWPTVSRADTIAAYVRQLMYRARVNVEPPPQAGETAERAAGSR